MAPSSPPSQMSHLPGIPNKDLTRSLDPPQEHLRQGFSQLSQATKGVLLDNIQRYSIHHHLYALSEANRRSPSLAWLTCLLEDMTDYILRDLDDGYRVVIDRVNARDNLTTFDDLLEKLLIQELSIATVQQQTPAPLTALNAHARPNYNDNKPRPAQLPTESNQRLGNRKPFLSKCQSCNVKGHVLSQCRTFRQPHPGIPPPPRDSP